MRVRVRVVASSGFVFVSTGIARTNLDCSNSEIIVRDSSRRAMLVLLTLAL